MNMKDSFVASPEYRQFIAELKARVLSARISVGRAANRDIILLYWDIGRGIMEKQERLGYHHHKPSGRCVPGRHHHPEVHGIIGYLVQFVEVSRINPQLGRGYLLLKKEFSFIRNARDIEQLGQ